MPTLSIGTLRIAALVGVALLIASGLGCQRSTQPTGSPAAPKSASAATPTSASPQSPANQNAGAKGAKARDAAQQGARPSSANQRDEKATSKAASSEAETATFVAPYPHRMDPFHRPDLHKLVQARGSARGDGADVRLKGFVNVDGLRALLAVDGNVVSVRPGEECAGVEVIEVAPPRVILQRGRLRWTEDLSTVQ